MKAMLLERLTSLPQNKSPLALADLPVPAPREGEILIRVTACGVCRTDLDEIEGRTPPPRLTVRPGDGPLLRLGSEGRAGDRPALPLSAPPLLPGRG